MTTATAKPPMPPESTRAFRDCLGHFASGVTVVTSRDDDGNPHGTTVSSFTSVSLEPPLILVSLARTARSCILLQDRPFVVNVLGSQQGELTRYFSGRPDPTGASMPWIAFGDVPALAGSVAQFVCQPWAEYDGGDHLLHVGVVTAFRDFGGEPLIFHRGVLRRQGRELRGTRPSQREQSPIEEGWWL